MQLSDSDILEFKRIYEAETRESLTLDEARDAANRLYRLLELLRDAIPKLKPDTLAKFKSRVMVKERGDEPPKARDHTT